DTIAEIDADRPAEVADNSAGLEPSAPSRAARAQARLVEYRPGSAIALPVHATLEVLDGAPLVEVPGAPAHCKALARWQGRWLPVLDPDALLPGACLADALPRRHLLVVAWQPGPGEPVAHGAIALSSMPAIVAVEDRMQCPLPDDAEGIWARLALSCFEHEG